MTDNTTFLGPVLHSVSLNALEIIPNCALTVSPNGKIINFKKDLTSFNHDRSPSDGTIYILKPGQFLIPGFVDTHNHAPQWPQRGLGLGLEILPWLDTITFPNEAKFSDPIYAKKMYSSCIDGFIRQGVTTASYYSSLHGNATKILAEVCHEKGQRALVGKCNMNQNSPDYYRDASVEESLNVTEEVIAHIRSLDPGANLIHPILTPRFAISCSESLLQGLGKMAAQDPTLRIQTHFNEAESEKAATLALFPAFKNESDLYEYFGLLNERSILAHCTIMDDYEIGRLEALKCGVAHCPVSNTTVGGGFMAAPIRAFLRRGIKVGLGTDSGGGFSSSILDAIRQAFIVGNARHFLTEGKEERLTLTELFYLATLGGSRVVGLDDKIGNFVVGKEFDAIVVDMNPDTGGAGTLIEEKDSIETLWEKFLVSGDDRNIVQVYVNGRLVKGQR